MKRETFCAAFAAAGFLLAVASPAAAVDPDSDAATLERGRYLTIAGGCNDCHTAGYAESAGKVPEADRLTGNRMGFSGPWGTVYAANLRLVAQSLDEAQWIAKVRAPLRPPMPWFNLRDMRDDDVRALYRYVRSLGPKGEPAPAYVAPGQPVATPYIVLVPQNLPSQQARR